MSKKVTANNIQEIYGNAEGQYGALETHRRSLEYLWRQSSSLTLPYIFPDEGISESSELPTPYNSIGPAGVNALAAKLLLTLLPPTGNFFRLLPYSEDVKDLDKEGKAQVDKALSDTEQDILAEIDKKALRVPLFEAMKYLIITGNTLVYKVPSGSIKTFSPYTYVVERDYVGNLLKLVIKESMSRTALPQNVQDILPEVTSSNANPRATGASSEATEDVDVYTVVILTGRNKYSVYQEIEGVMIPGSHKTYKKHLLPYIPLRWTSSNSEYYGRGLVEQYLGDLRRLETLSQLIVEGAAISAKTIFGLRPGSLTQLEDLTNAYNGDVILGDLSSEVTTWSVDKAVDFRIPMQVMEAIESRLSRAFMMMQGQIRDSERTTATEVRAVSAELEATLGGTYSILASDLQLPLVTLIMKDLNPQFDDLTEPTITTGTSAISREKDFNNLNTMLNSMAALGPEVIAQYLDVDAYLRAVSTSLGFDPDKLVKSEAQRQEEAAQQAALQQQTQSNGENNGTI